jgi:hypothetical protein
MPRPALVLACTVALGTGGVLAGCGSSSGGAGTAAPGPSASPTVSPCPAPSGAGTPHWPAAVPKDLPKPAHATIEQSSTTGDGVHITRFRTPTSLRESVLFVVNRLPKAGYVLGRGDAEASEADAPFLHGDVRGLYRMLQAAPCATEWLLATVTSRSSTPAPTSPLLPTRSPSGSPSPLPFG